LRLSGRREIGQDQSQAEEGKMEMDRRILLRGFVAGAAAAVVGVSTVPARAVPVAAAPIQLPGDGEGLITLAHVRRRRHCWWHRGRRICRWQTWHCWWHRGRRICGWR
jgi:hypothetical protein